jgi:hypothetical protein
MRFSAAPDGGAFGPEGSGPLSGYIEGRISDPRAGT